MVKKLFLIFITLFTFSNVNSQTNVVVQNFGCGTAINEYEFVDIINGKNHYQRLTVGNITPLGDSFGAVGGSSSVHIAFNGTDWIVYSNIITTVIFEQTTHTAGLLPPDAGWLGDGAPCDLTDSIVLLSGAVLDLDKESLDSKISIYPNPSSDFISVTNLKDAAKIRITNITGQTVMSDLIDQNNNQIDIKGLSKGFYFVEIEGKKTIKLIKK